MCIDYCATEDPLSGSKVSNQVYYITYHWRNQLFERIKQEQSVQNNSSIFWWILVNNPPWSCDSSSQVSPERFLPSDPIVQWMAWSQALCWLSFPPLQAVRVSNQKDFIRPILMSILMYEHVMTLGAKPWEYYF